MKFPFALLADRLLPWYRQCRRDLPWRHTRDPYAIMVSESMLQQTRVETVIPYYEKFMQAFPDVSSLATADDDMLMKIWQGLGYYRRARFLKQAAQTITTAYNGVFPDEREKIRALPGIGDYTAGAIASIAFGKRCTAVDGNVLRVISRVTGDDSDISLAATHRKFRSVLEKFYPEKPEDCTDFTQSMMELGATVCIPGKTPHCPVCPLALDCVAKKENRIETLPVKKRAKTLRVENWDVFFLVCRGHVALVRRPGKGLLANLYGFPMEKGFSPTEKLACRHADWKIVPEYKKTTHTFSHIQWRMRWYYAETTVADARFIWATPEDLQNVYPLPNAFRARYFFLGK